AGQELRVDGHTLTLRDISPGVVTERLAWASIGLKDGWLAFEGQTLESVAAEFNRHNARQLLIGDRATGQLRVGGKFRTDDLDGFVAALAVTHGVKSVVSPASGKAPEVILLTGRSSGSVYPEGPTDTPEE